MEDFQVNSEDKLYAFFLHIIFCFCSLNNVVCSLLQLYVINFLFVVAHAGLGLIHPRQL